MMIIYDWFDEFSLRSRRSRAQRCRIISFHNIRLSEILGTDEIEESGEPHNPETVAVDAPHKPPVHEEFFDTAVHVVEIELLVSVWSRVDDRALH